MGLIKKLPAYLINILKAGEIVERPASVVKELIENSLDASSSKIILEIKDGGKKLIKVEDDGVGISKEDLPLTIERYATSKIFSEEDLKHILTYGFRGEALAAISEVSKLKIISKIKQSKVAYLLEKVGSNVNIQPTSFFGENGTIVYVEDLFYNVPVRKKYLKAIKTEEKYILDTFLNFAIINYNISFKFIKDGKLIYDFKAVDSLLDRIIDIYPKNYLSHFKVIERANKDYKIYGIVSDANLTFLNPNNIKIFVNKRPIIDKIIKKAILDAYYRQLPSNEYPFSILFLEIDPKLLDVNVHPRKLEVKFLDPGSIYNFVKSSIETVFEKDKISSNNLSIGYSIKSANSIKSDIDSSIENISFGKGNIRKLDIKFNDNIFFNNNSFDNNINYKELHKINCEDKAYIIIGQLWNSYIVLQDTDNLYIVDQHALAERIRFEKLKEKYLSEKDMSLLLTPVKIEIGKDIKDLHLKIEKINSLGFDISLFGDNKIIVYSIPKVFEQYKVDINKLILSLLYLELEEISLEKILDKIWETKACKTSIKAGQKLSYKEMENLIEEGFKYIKGQFVCQHGRPSFVKISKQDIEKMFDR